MKTEPFALGFVWALIWQLILNLGPILVFLKTLGPQLVFNETLGPILVFFKTLGPKLAFIERELLFRHPKISFSTPRSF